MRLIALVRLVTNLECDRSHFCPMKASVHYSKTRPFESHINCIRKRSITRDYSLYTNTLWAHESKIDYQNFRLQSKAPYSWGLQTIDLLKHTQLIPHQLLYSHKTLDYLVFESYHRYCSI